MGKTHKALATYLHSFGSTIDCEPYFWLLLHHVAHEVCCIFVIELHEIPILRYNPPPSAQSMSKLEFEPTACWSAFRL